ncbi:MAG: hypothetical protein ACREAM_23035, partial [Blastocatellia bacterium]
MKSNLFARCFVVILLVASFVWVMNSSSSAQSGRRPLPPPSSQKQNERQLPGDSEKESERRSNRPLADNTPVVVDENGTIKMDTALVRIPVSVIDRDGKFAPFLSKRDFRLYEDGVE